MKSLLFLSLAVSLLVLPSAKAVESAYTRLYSEGQLKTLAEYWGSDDSALYRTRSTSQPDSIEGQYFVLKLTPSESTATSAQLTLIRNDTPDAVEYSFTWTGKPLKGWLYLGLTGEDWMGKALEPLAWRVVLFDATGQTLGEWKSFLWEMP